MPSLTNINRLFARAVERLATKLAKEAGYEVEEVEE